jgi:hypothetical protein
MSSKQPEEFLALSEKERKEILNFAATKLPFPAGVLEKDVWVCWALHHLFTMPGGLDMGFKGGTSLSKAYGAIQRFSEDVDVTIDYTSFETTPKRTISGNQIDKMSKRLRKSLKEHIGTVVMPYFQKLAKEQFADELKVSWDEGKDAILLNYPAAVARGSEYMAQSVQLEFGARNTTEPKKELVIQTYLSDIEYEAPIQFPSAKALVISLTRTYWEKVTALHNESLRPEFNKNSAHRFSRHWSDVAVLTTNELESDKTILESVVQHKQWFFRDKHSDYRRCLDHGFQLLPNAEGLENLQKDYEAMIEGRFFHSEHKPLSFDRLAEQISALEKRLNAT